MVSLTGNSHPIVTRGFRVSRAPPHHTLRGRFPAFLYLHGIKFGVEKLPVGRKNSELHVMIPSINAIRRKGITINISKNKALKIMIKSVVYS